MVSPFQGYNVSSESGKLPEQVNAAWCTDNFLSLLGVQPVLGRGFTANDDRQGAAATAILSSAFWKHRYGADPAVVGKTILLDAKPYTIIGVLPSSFVYSGAFGGNTVQVWTPVYHWRMTRDCKLYDPARDCWCDFRFRPTGDRIPAEQRAAA